MPKLRPDKPGYCGSFVSIGAWAQGVLDEAKNNPESSLGRALARQQREFDPRAVQFPQEEDE